MHGLTFVGTPRALLCRLAARFCSFSFCSISFARLSFLQGSILKRAAPSVKIYLAQDIHTKTRICTKHIIFLNKMAPYSFFAYGRIQGCMAQTLKRILAARPGTLSYGTEGIYDIGKVTFKGKSVRYGRPAAHNCALSATNSRLP